MIADMTTNPDLIAEAILAGKQIIIRVD